MMTKDLSELVQGESLEVFDIRCLVLDAGVRLGHIFLRRSYMAVSGILKAGQDKRGARSVVLGRQGRRRLVDR